MCRIVRRNAINFYKQSTTPAVNKLLRLISIVYFGIIASQLVAGTNFINCTMLKYQCYFRFFSAVKWERHAYETNRLRVEKRFVNKVSYFYSVF